MKTSASPELEGGLHFFLSYDDVSAQRESGTTVTYTSGVLEKHRGLIDVWRKLKPLKGVLLFPNDSLLLKTVSTVAERRKFLFLGMSVLIK